MTMSQLCSASTWPIQRRRVGTPPPPPPSASWPSPTRQSRVRNRRRRPRRRRQRRRRKDRRLWRRASPKQIESRGARHNPPRRAALEGQRKQKRLLTSLQSIAYRLPGRSRRRSSKATPNLSASGVAPSLRNRVARERRCGSAYGRAGREHDVQRPPVSRAARPRSKRLLSGRGLRLSIVIVTRRLGTKPLLLVTTCRSPRL